jgi:hypothetical protein
VVKPFSDLVSMKFKVWLGRGEAKFVGLKSVSMVGKTGKTLWQWQGQAAMLQSRATDELGHVQPSRNQIIADKGMNFYYHNNSIQTWQVSAQGEVRNVHA